MIYNYVLIDVKYEYLRYFYGGFINHVGRQFIQMKNESFVVDVRDLRIRDFSNKKQYCFIIGGRVYEFYGNYLISYLRLHYPGCKIVLNLDDLVKNHRFEIGNFNDWFNLVTVFDKRDAQEYNLKYLPMTFEYSSVKLYDETSDFFFAGGENQLKGRLEKVLELYRILVGLGYHCDFWLSDVPQELQDISSGIHYDFLPFPEMLSHLESTKCVVEIVQEGMSSSTIRYVESVLYGKHLLTNAETIKDDEIYGEYKKHVHVISDNMNFDFINEKVEYNSSKARAFFSNDAFIDAIENAICIDDSSGDISK